MSRHHPHFTKDFLLRVAEGIEPGWSYVNKFGRSNNVDSTVVPICSNEIYRTPTSATALRIKAGGNANDTAAGTGAQAITLIGLDENWALAEEEIETNGSSASSATTTTFIRLFRVYVSRSGTYSTQLAGSHAGTITIEKSTGSEDWAEIDATTFPRGQSQIGAYTIPANNTGYLLEYHAYVESNKTVDLFGFKREDADDVSSPYSGIMRLFDEFTGRGGEFDADFETPIKLPEKTDVGFMGVLATGATAATVSVQFHILLRDDSV